MKRLLFIIVLTVALLTGCAPKSDAIFRGELLSQDIKTGFFYSVATYTIETDTGNEYIFKVRNGWELPVGSIYVFKLHHVEQDMFVVVSIEQEEE